MQMCCQGSACYMYILACSVNKCPMCACLWRVLCFLLYLFLSFFLFDFLTFAFPSCFISFFHTKFSQNKELQNLYPFFLLETWIFLRKIILMRVCVGVSLWEVPLYVNINAAASPPVGRHELWYPWGAHCEGSRAMQGITLVWRASHINHITCVCVCVCV